MSVARTYARALFESSKGKSFEAEISAWVQLLSESKPLRVALLGPATSSREKVAIVEAIGKKNKQSPEFIRFLGLLARKGRFSHLEKIGEAFEEVQMHSHGGLVGMVVTADEMSSTDVKALSKAFEDSLGKKVKLRVQVDPSVLAGLKVTVNGITYDGTLKSQLENLRTQFVSGAAGNSNGGGGNSNFIH